MVVVRLPFSSLYTHRTQCHGRPMISSAEQIPSTFFGSWRRGMYTYTAHTHNASFLLSNEKLFLNAVSFFFKKKGKTILCFVNFGGGGGFFFFYLKKNKRAWWMSFSKNYEEKRIKVERGTLPKKNKKWYVYTTAVISSYINDDPYSHIVQALFPVNPVCFVREKERER